MTQADRSGAEMLPGVEMLRQAPQAPSFAATCAIVCLAMALLASGAVPACGEVFLLRNGGRVEGELLNRDEVPRRSYLVEVAPGARVRLTFAQVEKVLYVRPEEQEYERIRAAYPDTVEGQWALAEWCGEQRLVEQRERHLRRILELEPDHEQARQALGYNKVDGQWMTRDEAMARRGLIYYKGRWRTRQEIELMDNREQVEQAQQAWYGKLKMWRQWLGTQRDAQARQSIRAIDDPLAVPALSRALREDSAPAGKLLYIEALGRIATSPAVKALAEAAIQQPVEEVRLSCLDELIRIKSPEAVAYFVEQLRSKDNRIVNRAGRALGELGDPSAIGPLIDALVTTHKFKIVVGKPGSMSATFPTGGVGGSGLAMGGGPKIITRHLANQDVLDALVKVAGGVNFNFDERAWKYWYATQKRPAAVDIRRD